MKLLNEKEKAALETIKKAIADYEAELEAIMKTDCDDNDPIMLEGDTSTGYCVQLMVEPREVVPTLLKYDYPTFAVLGDDFPQEMWDELGRKFGLESVFSVDL